MLLCLLIRAGLVLGRTGVLLERDTSEREVRKFSPLVGALPDLVNNRSVGPVADDLEVGEGGKTEGRRPFELVGTGRASTLIAIGGGSCDLCLPSAASLYSDSKNER